jgi:hypothetical protein
LYIESLSVAPVRKILSMTKIVSRKSDANSITYSGRSA